jgi:hypothetical protein
MRFGRTATHPAFGAAAGLLAVLLLRWRCCDAIASGAEFLKIGGRFRLSLAEVLADVIGRLLREVAQKLVNECLDTFWFTGMSSNRARLVVVLNSGRAVEQERTKTFPSCEGPPKSSRQQAGALRQAGGDSAGPGLRKAHAKVSK